MSIGMLGRDVAMKNAVGKPCSVNALPFLSAWSGLSEQRLLAPRLKNVRMTDPQESETSGEIETSPPDALIYILGF